MSDASFQQFASWFRNSSPYINAHKGSILVLAFSGEAVVDDAFSSIVHDIALLSTLSVKLVLVHGARNHSEQSQTVAPNAPATSEGKRITDGNALAVAIQDAGELRTRIEALLSMGVTNSPMHNARIRVFGGNMVAAQPLGVHDGIDFQHTGKIRRVDGEGIAEQLNLGNIVLLSPLGYSPTGEIFTLTHHDVAVAAAVALDADKLILLEDTLMMDADGKPIRDLPLKQAQELFAKSPSSTLGAGVAACQQGIERCHVLDYRVDGALLQELFTRDGIGTMINGDNYETVRTAGIDDVGGIMELIAPLEKDGTLVRRSRERLELEINCFSVVERDGAIIGCAALYPDPASQCGELACVATHPAYQRSGRANKLLDHIESRARAQGIVHLFVLTTRAAHWFVERGFRAAELNELPQQRQQLYNFQRNSQVFFKSLA
jgi:amino-acid N-acetyltransferase